MNLTKNRSYILYSLIFLLFAISAYLAHISASSLNHHLTMVAGFIFMCLIGKLDANTWFHRIGATIFVVSVLLLVLILLTPDANRSTSCSLMLGGMKIEPMAFFAVGTAWLIGWLYSIQNDVKRVNIALFALMIGTAIFCIKVNDMRALPMLEAFFLAWLFYINGISKVSIASLLISLGSGIFFILSSSHRMTRITIWWESPSDLMTTLSADLNLHENILLALIDNLGYFTFSVVVLLFFVLSYILFTCKYKNRYYQLFAIGIVFLILIDLGLNIVYVFGLSPLYPPSLYLFEYGNSVALTSFIMMGMLMMGIEK